MLPDGADDLNWCFFGTSGVHGDNRGIDLLFSHDDADSRENPDVDYLTILVVQPRTVCLFYGKVAVRKTDLPWLRELAAETKAGVELSQYWSWPKPKPSRIKRAKRGVR